MNNLRIIKKQDIEVQIENLLKSLSEMERIRSEIPCKKYPEHDKTVDDIKSMIAELTNELNNLK